MTSNNGHHQAFEGVELSPDAESQALLELMALADDVEAGQLTEEGHRRAQEALTILQRDAEKETHRFPRGGGHGADRPPALPGDADPGG